MKEQVILTDKDVLTTAAPLYMDVAQYPLDKVSNYIISLQQDRPVAYAVYIGDGSPLQLINADILEKHVEFLGDL